MRCVNTACCTFESLTLHHCASPPTQPIVLIRVCVSLIEASHFINPSGGTTTSADLRCAAYCRYRCVPSAATRSGAQCRCHSAAAVSLSRCRSVSADPCAYRCTAWTVLQLLPDLLVFDRASHQSPCARRTPRGRFSSSQALTRRAKLTPRGLRSSCQVRSLVVIVHLSLVFLLRMSIRRCLSSDAPPGSVLRVLDVIVCVCSSSPATKHISVQYVGLSEATP